MKKTRKKKPYILKQDTSKKRLVIYCDRVPTKERPWWDEGKQQLNVPARTLKTEERLRDLYLKHTCGVFKDYEGDLKVQIVIFARKSSDVIQMPDLDNVAKIILDSLKGAAYRDDSQVVQLEVFKFEHEGSWPYAGLEDCNFCLEVSCYYLGGRS